jgi:hypothetical protein
MSKIGSDTTWAKSRAASALVARTIRGGGMGALRAGWIATTPSVSATALLTCGLTTLALVAATDSGRSSSYPSASS